MIEQDHYSTITESHRTLEDNRRHRDALLSRFTTVKSGAVENRTGAYSTIGSIHTMYKPTGIFTGGIGGEGLAPRLDTPARRAGIMRSTPYTGA